MTIDKNKMNEIFGKLDKDKPVAILTHGFPDPDSIGSSAGMALLLKEVYGLSSKAYHLGSISHPQNKTLKNVLHIQLEDAKNFKPGSASAIVVLDTDLMGTGLKDIIGTADLRIDHHLMSRDEVVKLSDVRVVGAASSIVWEYLKEFGIDLNENRTIATAMAIGIITDTNTFTSQNTEALDIDAFRALIQFADKTLMTKILQYPLPKYTFDVEMLAYKEKEVKNTTLFTYIRDVSQHRDSIATVADRFIRIDGIDSVMVAGLVGNDLVFSVRSDDARIDVDSLIVSIFGRQYGGGKEGCGGATFPLGMGIALIADKKIRESAINEIVNGFKNKLFEVLGETKDEKEESK